jgi:hypothetical protein
MFQHFGDNEGDWFILTRIISMKALALVMVLFVVLVVVLVVLVVLGRAVGWSVDCLGLVRMNVCGIT